jgi:hypothetical protein
MPIRDDMQIRDPHLGLAARPPVGMEVRWGVVLVEDVDAHPR